MMIHRLHCGVAMLLVAVFAAPGLAVHADIEVDVEGGQLIVEDGPFFEGPLESDFNLDGTSWRGTEPGFDAEGTLSSNETITFNVTGPLLHWDGAAWSPDSIPAFHQLTFRTPLSAGTLTIDGLTAFANGFTIDTADGNGDLHQHLVFDLNRGDGGVVTRGDAYAVQLQLDSQVNEASDTFFIALNNGMDESTFDAAFSQLPEPASFLVVGAGAVLVLSRRGRSARGG